MALNELALEIYLVVLCLNAMVLVVDGLQDTALKTPFDLTSGDVSGIDSGPVTDIYNSTTFGSDTTLTGNLTSGSGENATIGGTSATLNPVDTLLFPLTLLWAFIQFVTGGFIFQVIGLIGFPDVFVFAMQAIIGILFARMILYYVFGR